LHLLKYSQSEEPEMAPAPIHADEIARLSVLRKYRLEQIQREETFDRLTAVVAKVMGAPIALVTLIDEEDQCFAGATGLEQTGTSRDAAFCAYTILGDTPVIVADATQDLRFADSPLVLGSPFIRFYAGIPLVIDGQRLGSLCIIDTVPRSITTDEIDTLIRFAGIVEDMIRLRLAKIENADNQQRIAGFLEATPVALAIYDTQDRLLSVNTEYRTTFFRDAKVSLDPGLSFPEILDLVDEHGRQIKVEGEAAEWKQRRIDLRRKGAGSYEMEVDGVWLVCNETRTANGELLAAFTDITGMKQRAVEAATQSMLLRSILENLDQGIALFCPKGRLLACSEAYFDLLSFPRHLRKEGVHFVTLVKDLLARGSFGKSGDSPTFVREMLAANKAQRTRSMDLHSADNRIIAMTNTVMEDGRLIVTCTDVTERRESSA
jgi:PAS domain-containing protein